MAKPTVGRIVHYVEGSGGECLAAIVTEVHPTGNLNLAVFEGNADQQKRYGVDQAPVAGPRVGGQWHWPEREEEAK